MVGQSTDSSQQHECKESDDDGLIATNSLVLDRSRVRITERAGNEEVACRGGRGRGGGGGAIFGVVCQEQLEKQQALLGLVGGNLMS